MQVLAEHFHFLTETNIKVKLCTSTDHIGHEANMQM